MFINIVATLQVGDVAESERFDISLQVLLTINQLADKVQIALCNLELWRILKQNCCMHNSI